MQNQSLKNWVPYKLNFETEEMLCEWLFVGEKPFTEPFFEDTILVCKNFKENQNKYKSASSFEAITSFSEYTSYIKPTAFIFHVSRSGSTLLAQLLSLDIDNIVVAEAPFFDEILREINISKFKFSMEEIIQTFRAALKYYGKKRNGNEQNYFIKLDSWHLMYFELIRKAFPETPFIFSYRKPDEVVKSHGKLPGLQAVPGLLQPTIFGIILNDELLVNHQKYTAILLEKYFEKMMEISKIDKNTLFIDYADGIFTNIEHIETFLNLKIKESVKKQMEERTKFHSKKPTEVFSEINVNNELPDFQKKGQELYQKLKINMVKN
jgi:hypothetical protein